jgi:predicted MFS family arabinose efflux permease
LLSTATVAMATVTLGLGARHLPVSLVACAVFGWGFVAASSALISWCVLATPQGAAAGTSLLFVMLVLGQAAGSTAVGASSDLPSAFVVAAVVAVLAAACGALPVRADDRPGTREALVTPARRG